MGSGNTWAFTRDDLWLKQSPPGEARPDAGEPSEELTGGRDDPARAAAAPDTVGSPASGDDDPLGEIAAEQARARERERGEAVDVPESGFGGVPGVEPEPYEDGPDRYGVSTQAMPVVEPEEDELGPRYRSSDPADTAGEAGTARWDAADSGARGDHEGDHDGGHAAAPVTEPAGLGSVRDYGRHPESDEAERGTRGWRGIAGRRSSLGEDFPDFDDSSGRTGGEEYPGYDNIDYFPETEPLATATLWLGILAVVAFPIGAVPGVAALLTGPRALRNIDGSGGEFEGANFVRIGRYLAWAGIALCAVGLLVGGALTLL